MGARLVVGAMAVTLTGPLPEAGHLLPQPGRGQLSRQLPGPGRWHGRMDARAGSVDAVFDFARVTQQSRDAALEATDQGR